VIQKKPHIKEKELKSGGFATSYLRKSQSKEHQQAFF